MKTTNYGMGWQRDLPDIRDYTPENEKIEKLCPKELYDYLTEEDANSYPSWLAKFK